MKGIIKVFAFASGLVFSLNASALTVSSLYGDIDGLGLNIQSVAGASSVLNRSSSSFGLNSLNAFSGDGTDMFRAGDLSFTQRVSLGSNIIIESAFLEITAGGHGLTSLSSVYIDGIYLGHLSDGDGIGPLGGRVANSLYNTLNTYSYDLSSHLRYISDGTVNVRIQPGKAARDTWAMDYARLVVNYRVVNQQGNSQDPVTPGPTAPVTPGPVTPEPTGPVTPAPTAPVTPVPVPAAFWLLLSGIVFLVRKRKA